MLAALKETLGFNESSVSWQPIFPFFVDEPVWHYRYGAFHLDPFRRFKDSFNFWYMPELLRGWMESRPTDADTRERVANRMRENKGVMGPIIQVVFSAETTDVSGDGVANPGAPSPTSPLAPGENAKSRVQDGKAHVRDSSDNAGGVLVHELGHALFAFIDEYDSPSNQQESFSFPTATVDASESWDSVAVLRGTGPPGHCRISRYQGRRPWGDHRSSASG